MSPRPRLTPTQVTLTISDDPSFTPRFGHRVLRAGGRYTDLRGHKHRMVTLPGGNDGLVDAIAEEFNVGRTRIFVLRWTAEGFDGRLGEALSDPANLEAAWDKAPGTTASHAVYAKGRAVSAAFDWETNVARWRAEDERRVRGPCPDGGRRPAPVEPRDAGARIAPRGPSAIETTMRDIAEEAVRILDGEPGTDVLKALAARYRRLREAQRDDGLADSRAGAS